MSEQNQNNTQPKRYKLRQSIIVGLWLVFLRRINRVLNFFNLIQSKQFWGIVYDSASKQPLDPVIVKLLYVDGHEVQTCVTDLSGRYGFLARPGKFKIFARKTNYLFPSKQVRGDIDGVYENLYHGEFFELRYGSEVIGPNIPMDPEDFDWNQKAKQQLINRSPFFRLFFKRLMGVFFWFGFIFCSVYMAYYYPHIPIYLYTIAAIYFVLLFLSATAWEARLWGKLKVKPMTEEYSAIFLELHNTKFPAIVLGQTQVHEDGKFLLRANKGHYILFAKGLNEKKEKVFLAQTEVKVSRTGVLNSTLILK